MIIATLGTFTAATAGEGQLKLRLSCGHQSPAGTSFFFRVATNDIAISDFRAEVGGSEIVPLSAEYQTSAGGGTVVPFEFTLHYPEREIRPITNLHSIWGYLLAHSDADTARRLQSDPGYRPDTRKVTFAMDRQGTRGFSVTVDQLLTQRVFWVPALDVFLAAGDPPVSFAEHQKALESYQGKRILDQVQREPEASYAQFVARWEDMGSPAYRNAASIPPGHIVGLTWDSALYKFGIDRGAGVRNDYGNLDRFRFGFDFGELSQLNTQSWRGQKLTQGLPVITTVIELANVRYEVEQFAYPLHGPPPERRGDIPMVLLQKVRLTDLSGRARTVPVRLSHARQLPASTTNSLGVTTNRGALLLEHPVTKSVMFAVEGEGVVCQSDTARGPGTNTVTIAVDLPAAGSREFVVKLPSPVVSDTDAAILLALDYSSCRNGTLAFWTNYLARGAQLVVPEESVNTLFRASLWHALRLPRRHSREGSDIDLPYSNFAYDQNGIPWPVNQAAYVDYMLYDLRGYHGLSAEELAAMFGKNQEANGHIKGFANWGVYTPSMVYAVAQHFLLSGDRRSFDALLPQTLKALDWCLGEIRNAATRPGDAPGLVLAPLNDLSHDPRAWAYNQSYLFAGPELLGRALADIGHPRAAECRAAAQAMRDSVQRRFAIASVQSPLVQLRDHSWTPYVPCDALSPRRLLDVWYPTEVDTGALHLPRLKVLDPNGTLTSYLLHDHEDNLFLHGWGMANEPVYNQQATVYLLRDDVKAVVRAFYSMMACAFSQSVFEPVEHRWAWGQYFGPPSTDGAWFELFRHMLIHEGDDDTLLLLQATPRQWLEDGKQIRVERAPTYFGELSLILESLAGSGMIRTTLELPMRKRPAAVVLRLRHPQGKAIRSVTVNGEPWTDFDVPKEWIRIPQPEQQHYAIITRY